MRTIGAGIGIVALVAVGGYLAAVLVPRDADSGSPSPVLVTQQTIGGAEAIQPYDAADVSEAFEAAGIEVELSRTDARGCSTESFGWEPPAVRGIGRVEWSSDCLVFSYKNGKLVRDKRTVIPGRARLLGWTADDRQWAIMVYGNPDFAARATNDKEAGTTRGLVLHRLVRFARAENVVVMFSRAGDASRVREVLDGL